MTIQTIIRNSVRSGYLSVMAKKLVKRLEKDTGDEARLWAEQEVSQSTEDYCQRLDPQLWQEVKSDCDKLHADATRILSRIPHQLGGGGNYPLINFMIRKYRPETVIETGVAAGWSSLSILRAFAKNETGRLFSSDFPYFRLENPEQYIGILARDEPNAKNWDLDVTGDQNALPNIVDKLGTDGVDLLHYDSDKSYSGRVFALETLQDKIGPDTILIFDDIQDNLHFRDMVTERGTAYVVLGFEGKYVGIINPHDG